jgi:hypothetical protein
VAYQYRGTTTVEEEPEIIHAPGKFNPQKCGTMAGYRQHQKLGIGQCQPCKDACASYARDYYHRRRKTGYTPFVGFDPSACGTYAGWARHRRSDVPPCDACKVAHSDYMFEYRANRKAAA